MSALISAACPDKMDKKSKLRATSGATNIQQSSPFSYPKYREIHCKIRAKNEVNRFNYVQKASDLEKKSNTRIIEM